MGVKITGVRKTVNGEIRAVKLNNGAIVSFDEVRSLVDQGEIDSLTSLDENGNWTIEDRTGDGLVQTGENLSVLPEF